MKNVNFTTADPFDPGNIFSPYKILTFPEVLERIADGRDLRPINLEINPINFCNQSCTWCTYGYLHNRPEKLEISQVLSLLADAVEMGVQSVTWTGGGEPTAYKWLMQGLERASEYGFSQGINTNGSNLPIKMQHLISDTFDYIRFSVDAGTPETYAKTHRVKLDAYDKVISNIAAICDRRSKLNRHLTVGFSFLVDNSNVHDLAIAAKLAKATGVDYFQIKPIVNYESSNAQFESGSELWSALDEELGRISDLPDDSFDVQVLGHKFNDITEADMGRTYDTCRGNELLATVGADGSVDVCCAYKGQKKWSFGNLKDASFREIWESPERKAILASIDVTKCPPLCKAHEINKVIHYMRSMRKHRNFV